MVLPKKAQAQWRKYWFYASEHTRAGEVHIAQYSPEPSEPRRLNVRSLPRDQEEVVKAMRLAIQTLKDAGLTAANMYNCWLARRLIPLRSRGHYMWEYRGQNDCTHSTAAEWSKDEYWKALAKITTATFTTFDAELHPFSEDKPTPKRWQKISNHLPPLAGKEPLEMTEGEEVVEDEEEDDGDSTESDSEAQDFIRREKAPAAEPDEPRPKRLRQTILEGATVLQRPLKAALDAGARVGPGVKTLPTVKARTKVLQKPAAACGVAATRAADAKKAAGVKKAAADPADMASSRGQATTAAKTASAAGASTEAEASASAARTTATKTAAEPVSGKGPEGERPVVPPSVSEEQVAAKEGGSSAAPSKERRTKAARDPARHEDPLAPKEGAPSTEAVLHDTAPEAGDELRNSHQSPLASLSFAEIHEALGEVHAAEVRRLAALVEEGAKKNRALIAIGKAREKALAEAREGYVKESLYREADFRATEGEAAAKRAKSEVADLTKVLEGKSKELEDVIAEHQVKLAAALQERDVARTATTTVKKQLAALAKKHAEELAAKEASAATLLAVQKEKTSFEAFVREMSRQLLGTCEFVETATPRECLETATTRIIQCAGDILAALQYLSPRERIPRDAASVFKAVTDIPAVVD
ncbi:hypothetical protein ACQ4PT_052260 [Festuca glaucescens]